jgi:hypothetical protein
MLIIIKYVDKNKGAVKTIEEICDRVEIDKYSTIFTYKNGKLDKLGPKKDQWKILTIIND